MKVSYDWLSSMVELPEDPSELAREFIRTGTEVESIDTVGEAYHKIVTAKVVSKEAHPDSDHLWVTMVDVGANNVDADGNPEPLQIVCGAQNFNEGDHIVTAMIGAELPGDVHIKKGQAARRRILRHELLRPRARPFRRSLRHLDPPRGCARGHAARPVSGQLRYGPRLRDHAQPPRLPVHDRHRPRGRRHLRPRFLRRAAPGQGRGPARAPQIPSPSSSSTRACATATSPAWCAASRWAPRPNGSSSA